MTEDPLRGKLSDAKGAFDAGRLTEAEAILKELPQDSLKVKHNLVVVQYLLRQMDSEKAITSLRSGGDGEAESGERKTGPLTLQYEGHETAIYNQAVLYARSGLLQDAVIILRSMLEMAKDIALPVLTHSLCLFQTLTRPSPNLGSRPRSKQDEDLIQKVLNEKMPEISQDPSLLSLVTAAFADSSNLHEVFKTATSRPLEQSIYLNNLGVFSLNDDKASVATLCFSKAQKLASGESNAHMLQQSITYNAALCALLKAEYDEAIRLFLTIQDGMRQSPLFWVRFAEAAVGAAHRHWQQRRKEDYERIQNYMSQQLQTGKVYANFDFMLLPGTIIAQGAAPEPSKESTLSATADQLAASAVQNALFLLIPKGHSFHSALDAFPQQEQMLQYAMLYWTALELIRKNYAAAAEVAQDLLSAHERHPLSGNLHATVLCYAVEALVHLNDPERAMKVLRRASLSSMVSGNSTEHLDAAQRSRVESLFVNLAVTHILTGSWNQAHAILESLLGKISEVTPAGATDYRPEKDVIFAYQMLAIFLELAQGNQERAMESLSKISWSV